MAFFNKKEEVIDIKLTQFGKNCLARGAFIPVYYQFFDDDILYNSENGGFSEHQNDSEERILENTPRLKTIHLAHSVETQYFSDDEQVVSGNLPRFQTLRRNVDPDIQGKILSYALGEQDVQVQELPRFSVVSMDALFTTGTVSYYSGTYMEGVTNKIPQIEINPSLQIARSVAQAGQTERITDEDHFDILSGNVKFADGTQLISREENILLDIQELSSFYGLDNFEIEVYEVVESEEKETLIRIDDPDEVMKRFKIRTDEDIEEINHETQQQTNYRRRGED